MRDAARNDEFLLLDALGDILDIVEGWTPRSPAEKIEAVREVLRRLDTERQAVTAATTLEREIAARLQEQADEVRDGTSDRMHRIVRATGGGWVEIQGEYLGHLIDRLDALLADNERDFGKYVEKIEADLTPEEREMLDTFRAHYANAATVPSCSRCGKPWEQHYDPALLRFKNGPFGTFGLTADHTPHIVGVHAQKAES